MPVQRQAGGDRARAAGERVARPGNRRAAEVQRVVARVEHDLDDVRVERLPPRRRSGGTRCHRRIGALRPAGRATRRISAGSSSGSSPCTLTTISSSSSPSSAAASARRSVPVAWSARVMTASTPCARDGSGDARIVGGDDHARAHRLPARARPPERPSAARRCRRAACRAGASTRSAPGSGR